MEWWLLFVGAVLAFYCSPDVRGASAGGAAVANLSWALITASVLGASVWLYAVERGLL